MNGQLHAYVALFQEGDPSVPLNPLNAELNPICHLLALLGVHFLHVNRIRVNKRLDGHQKQSGLFWSRDTDLEYFGYRYEIPRTPGT